MNEKISLIVVNFRGGRHIDLLLQSLQRTISSRFDFEVIVVDNFRQGILLGNQRHSLKQSFSAFKSLFASRVSPEISNDYEFSVPEGLDVTRVATSRRPVFWDGRSKGLEVAVSHAAGLEAGYDWVSKDSEYVVLVDSDVAFMKSDWPELFLRHFRASSDTVLVGTFRQEQRYARPFLRPFCLMMRQRFYQDIDQLFFPTSEGGTCSNITYACENGGKQWHVFQNSLEDREVERMGCYDLAVDEEGEVILYHFDDGSTSSSSALDEWQRTMQRYLEADGADHVCCGTLVPKHIQKAFALGRLPGKTNFLGLTPYEAAYEHADEEAIAVLDSLNAVTAVRKESEFLNACWMADRSRVSELLQQNPDIVSSLGKREQKLLTSAAAENHADAVKLMLEVGFDPKIRGFWGGTALHQAVLFGHFETVTVLLSFDVSLTAHDKMLKAPPLWWALFGNSEKRNPQGRYVETVKALLKAGAPVSRNAPGEYGVSEREKRRREALKFSPELIEMQLKRLDPEIAALIREQLSADQSSSSKV